MLQGKSLQELGAELDRQKSAKKDMIADTKDISISVSNGDDINPPINSVKVGHEYFEIGNHMHNQLAARLKVPGRFYDRMRTNHPDILQYTVNELLEREPERRMIRTLDGTARAFLSDRYKRIDHDLIAGSAYQALMESGQEIQVASSNITPSRMYIKALFPRLQGEVKVNDLVQAGVIITNSEVGLGSFEIKPFVYRLVCTNGMTVPMNDKDMNIKRRHIGAKIGDLPGFVIPSDETIAAETKALQLEIKDTINAMADGSIFEYVLHKMQASSNTAESSDVEQTIEVLGKAYGLSEAEQSGMLTNLIKDSDITQWGFVNSITALANDNDSYDRASDLESIGGMLLNLNQSQWEKIAVAA
jgi:hypothetical protein